MRATRSYIRAVLLGLAVALAAGLFLPANFGCSAGQGGVSPDLAAVQKGTIYYIGDHLGSAQVVADAESGVLYEEVIYPYGLNAGTDGNLLNGETSEKDPGWGADYTYTTKEHDPETGLIYFGARYYAPEMGRWISPDPLFLDKPKTALNNYFSINLYSFSRNNPESYVDPDGAEEGIVFEVMWGEEHARMKESLPSIPRNDIDWHEFKRQSLQAVGGLAALTVGATVGCFAPELIIGGAAVYHFVDNLSFLTQMKMVEVTLGVLSLDNALKLYQTSEAFLSGYTRADAPSNWAEFYGAAYGHGIAINEGYGFIKQKDLEGFWGNSNQQQSVSIPMSDFEYEE